MLSQSKFDKFYSCEFFPPKTEQGAISLRAVFDKLLPLNPEFFSVTYGAGGSTQDKTYETVIEIQHQVGVDAAPHLSCIGATREALREIIHNYCQQGIKRIVALRGDMPSGMRYPGEFRYANELVEFIREEAGNQFYIEVAAYPEVHPQAVNADFDLSNFKAKIDAGADSAITQYFYNVDAYFNFVDICEKHGIDTPIVPGVMPITNYFQLSHFSEMCGSEIPRWMRKRLEGYGDDRDSIVAFGLDVVSNICQRLLDNDAPGLHFYTMNQSKPVLAIWENLNLPKKTDKSSTVKANTAK